MSSAHSFYPLSTLFLPSFYPPLHIQTLQHLSTVERASHLLYSVSQFLYLFDLVRLKAVASEKEPSWVARELPGARQAQRGGKPSAPNPQLPYSGFKPRAWLHPVPGRDGAADRYRGCTCAAMRLGEDRAASMIASDRRSNMGYDGRRIESGFM